MPWNEMTGQFEDTPGVIPRGKIGPYTPGNSTDIPGPPTPSPGDLARGTIQRSPLNDQLGGKRVLRAEDNPIKDNDQIVPGMWRRTLFFEDGTTKEYAYSVIEHPENANGTVNDWVPVGAKYLGEDADQQTVKNYIDQQRIIDERKARETSDQQQNAAQAGNMATQTGNVMVPGPDGNPVPQLDASGQPIPTLAREQLNRQTAAQEGATETQRQSNEITRQRNADQAIYEQAQLAATKERDRLNNLVSMGTLQATNAKEKFDEWLQLNVTVPFKQMEEARARATEARLAQEAEDKRRQDAANFEQTRQTTALGVGNEAIKASVATLPYMSGPNWGSQFGNALTAVAQGKPQNIHFDSSGLNFQSPDFQAIAEGATARALAHLSPYAAAIAQAGDRPGGAYATTDYSQVPNIPSTSGAPVSPDVTQQMPPYSSQSTGPAPSASAGTMPQGDQWR